ncbi:MAG: urease accessory protein UreD [Betaproteobacteria bacterium]|nr:urease accessory protein UreD [Betaproteobacteria bacterium]
MNATVRLAEIPLQSAWEASLDLSFECRATRTVLARNAHFGPLRVQKALYPEGDAVCQAIVLHPPSGIAGGDRLNIHVAAGKSSQVQVTTPGAGKWYRSAGPLATQHVSIHAGPGATVEWLPQENIVFDGAIAHMGTTIELATDARLIAWDILCLGRSAAGERFCNGRFDLTMSINRDGVPLWRERGGFDGGDMLLDSTIAWAGHTVSGTLLASFPGLPQQAAALLERCRAIQPDDAAAHSLTALPNAGGLLIARYLGDSGEAARRWLTSLWHEIRPACCGRAALNPRIWNT